MAQMCDITMNRKQFFVLNFFIDRPMYFSKEIGLSDFNDYLYRTECNRQIQNSQSN
jgi:hypothetical protein